MISLGGPIAFIRSLLAGRAPSAAMYRAYTRKFDVEVEAESLHTVIGTMLPKEFVAAREAQNALTSELTGWRTRLHLAAAEASARIREALPLVARQDTVVSLLFDQSGSMRGQKMLFAAAAADVCQEFLATLKIRVEVLGFTTVRWRGGQSRERWVHRGSVPNPGRLNDLLHIIYRDADDERASAGAHAYAHMLRPDLPKENVDGEALLWAASRLRARKESRKILVVISDGAPVDDSTLMSNGPSYLEDHLIAVVADLQGGDIELAAMGLGFAVDRYYRQSSHVEGPSDLGGGLLGLLEEVLLSADRTGDGAVATA